MKISGEIFNDIEQEMRDCDRTDNILTIGPGGTEISPIEGIQFFSFIGASIQENPDVERSFKRIDMEITGGSQEFVEIFDIQNANTGITSSQEIPIFTNISEGRGIFTSRNRLLDARQLSPNSMDSLRQGVFTRDLNFQ